MNLTLVDVYQHFAPALQQEIQPSSLEQYRYALKHWQQMTGNPVIEHITKQTLQDFRERFTTSQLSLHTAAKTWRYIRRLGKLATKLPEYRSWSMPELTINSASILFRPGPVWQRETISHEEIDLLWKRAAIATYPIQQATPQWRLALVLLWFYGPRTSDLLSLSESSILWRDNLIRFTARKTNKLQGLPLTETVSRHLREWLTVKPAGPLLFPGFRERGWFKKSTGRWQVGWRTTWKTELAQVGSVKGEPGSILTPITFKNFRQTMLTRLNDVTSGVGNWVAGHYQSGVSERHYDAPDARIREAFSKRTPPACFAGGLLDGVISQEQSHGSGSAGPGVHRWEGIS